MKTKAVAITIAACISPVACVEQDDYTEDPAALEDESEESHDASDDLRDPEVPVIDVYPDLALESPFGSLIEFFHDPTDDVVVVVESGQTGHVSVLRHPLVEDAAPLEIFWALTRDGVEAPQFLVDSYFAAAQDVSRTNSAHVERGALLDVDPNDTPRSLCNANACLILGWTTIFCEFDVSPTASRYWSGKAGSPDAGNEAYGWACNLGSTKTVSLQWRYNDACNGSPYGSYYNIVAGGFPTLTDGEEASWSTSHSSYRTWYMTKQGSPGSGSTDMALKTYERCPAG